jgi:hypothetical protein
LDLFMNVFQKYLFSDLENDPLLKAPPPPL